LDIRGNNATFPLNFNLILRIPRGSRKSGNQMGIQARRKSRFSSGKSRAFVSTRKKRRSTGRLRFAGRLARACARTAAFVSAGYFDDFSRIKSNSPKARIAAQVQP